MAFDVTADADFPGVIAGCAAPGPGREDTWINPEIERLFLELHRTRERSLALTEDGAMSSWIAAATSYANHGVPTIPFYVFYSMFGMQRRKLRSNAP